MKHMSLELPNTNTFVEAFEEDAGFEHEHVVGPGKVSQFIDRYLTGKNTFLLFVLLPSLFAGIYYGFVVSPQYVTETRMIVRTIGVSEKFDTSEEREGRSLIGGDSLTQDSYIVANFLESPEIVKSLDEELDLRKLFSRNDIDFLSRLSSKATFETLHSYWREHIDTYVDGPSGIIIFTVRAFSPEDSVLLLQTTMSLADKMIAKLSERAKDDLVERARNDFDVSLKNYQTALGELRAYQNKTGILDPISRAKVTTEVITKLTEQKLRLTVELDAMGASNAIDSAKARQLRRAVEALDQQIKAKENSLAGVGADSEQLSKDLVVFSRLETRLAVTEALYKATARNLDTAKATALRRTTFISTFSPAYLPEESRYPKRFASWVIFTLGMFTLWVCGTLIWMSIQDHRA